MKSDDELTGYHEAGHAVAAVLLGIGLQYEGVTIAADAAKGYAGFTHAVTHTGMSERTLGVYALAGEAAQRVFQPRCFYGFGGFLRSGCADDYKAFARYMKVKGHGANDMSRLVRRYQRAARGFVCEHWENVERVASALLEHETLDSIEVHQLVHIDKGKMATLIEKEYRRSALCGGGGMRV
jgi:ATP-dependent Zn protease